MKVKNDRLEEMANIITMMANDEEILDIDIKHFIIDMAHTFNLRKKEIDIIPDVNFIINAITNKGYYVREVEEDLYKIIP